MEKLSRREFLNDITLKSAAISLPMMVGGMTSSCISIWKAMMPYGDKYEVTFTDNRGRKIVYISNCLLNQNARSPGVAVRKGANTELIEIFLDNDIGIEQLPCLECILWGGVSRKDVSKWQPVVLNSVGKAWFPIIESFAKMRLWKTKQSCQREADKVVDRIEDYTLEKYTILGVIGINGSPTCGVTRTMDYLYIAKNHKSLGISLEDLEKPRLEKVRDIEAKVQFDGPGFFFGPLMEELKKREMDIKVIGYEPWSEPKEEAERIAGLLNLKF